VASAVWAHDASHRAGVPYANQAMRTQYQGNVRQNVARPSAGQVRTQMQPQSERFGNRQVPNNAAPAQNRGFSAAWTTARRHGNKPDHGYSSIGRGTQFACARAAPAQRSAPAKPGLRRRRRRRTPHRGRWWRVAADVRLVVEEGDDNDNPNFDGGRCVGGGNRH